MWWLQLSISRLDRLHIRTDAAWAALDAALSRRCVVARAIALVQQDSRLRAAADAAEASPRSGRELAENRLTRILTDVTHPALSAELADAQHRVMLARLVYNDAVTDTRALRATWAVRFFHQAGRAPLPDYFEINDQY
ncbi:NUDIX hydrolase [Pseudonocardiaceae bacterium YIM PH 21723]|nr:NUDIX hydrolase [Pseudonocardiaceae bacterium YIM PH 21723]